MKKNVYILILLIGFNLYSQNLTLFDIDETNFPIVKANFFLYDENGEQIYNVSQSDFEIYENGENREIVNISCPPPPEPIPISSVLVIDVSGSMLGGGLLMAKEAAHTWLNILHLGLSECAITAFDNQNYIVQDFTTNRSLLSQRINSLSAKGGTDYNAAFINPMAGGLLVSKEGKHKKVILMLTDGESTPPDINRIINEANQQNCAIYTVCIRMYAPYSLQMISEQTGGKWYQSVSTVEEIQNIYRNIFHVVQNNKPCTIEWESKKICVANLTNVELNYKPLNTFAQSNYVTPYNSIPRLEFEPSSVKFEEPIPGVKIDRIIEVRALNSDFTVTNISCANEAFDINPKSFTLQQGQSRNLTVNYTPADSGYTFGRFDFETDICPGIYYASGGWFGKKPKVQTLKLIQPNGGENFIVGMDTVITWEGILPEESVKIEYTTNNGIDWYVISDSATGLSYNWNVPNTPSDQCLARVTTEIGYVEYEDEMIVIPAGSFYMGNTGAYTGFIQERPTHRVTISKDFLLGKYEVTQKQYFAVMGENPSYWVGEDLPVERVSWYDAIEFCNKLSDLHELDRCYTINGTNVQWNKNANGYRLPTEAEWEYACKAGTEWDFYNGNLTHTVCEPIDDKLNSIGWFCGNSKGKTHVVGQKEANIFGLYDMSGNVWEWCWDWYSSYTGTDKTDPSGPLTGSYRVVRGGSWQANSINCRSAFRSNNTPEGRYFSNGFRIARNY